MSSYSEPITQLYLTFVLKGIATYYDIISQSGNNILLSVKPLANFSAIGPVGNGSTPLYIDILLHLGLA